MGCGKSTEKADYEYNYQTWTMMPRKIAGERTSSCKSIIIIHKPKTEQRNMHQLSLVNEANSYLEESPVLSPPQARNSIEDLKGFKLILETANSDQEA